MTMRLPVAAGRPEKRVAERRPSEASVSVDSSRGESCEARVKDVSNHGCNLLFEAQWPRTGHFITIRYADAEPIAAVIRWSREGSVGVEFLRPIALKLADAMAGYTG